MGELGGEQAQLVGQVGGVGLAGEHEGVLVDREGEADPPPGQQPLHPVEVETGEARGRDQPGRASRATAGRARARPCRAPKRSRTWTEPRSNSVCLKVRVEPLAKRTMVTSMSSIRWRETSRPGGPSGGRSSKLTRRSAGAHRRRGRARGGEALGQRGLAALDRLPARPAASAARSRRTWPASPRRSAPGSSAAHCASKLSSTVCARRDDRAVVDRADQLLGADLRLHGRLALRRRR